MKRRSDYPRASAVRSVRHSAIHSRKPTVKVLFNKVDMDTCLTALILGVSEKDEIVALQRDAASADLVDPTVVCIEVGGSGQVDRNNFDHHDCAGPLEPACEQAFAAKGGDDDLERLVKYVSTIDSTGGTSEFEKTQPPYLSSVFSGMLLSNPEPTQQLWNGIKIFATVLNKKIDPFGTMPPLEEWQEYIKAYESNARLGNSVRAMVKSFTTTGGLRGGFVETDYIGAPGLIYSLGYDAAVVCHPRYGLPPVRKFTIAGKDINLEHLKSALNALERGWGGSSSGTILGSPRNGSKLSLQEVVNVVIENL